jgi:ribosomal protein S18 acetylase RimI-like enzyme
MEASRMEALRELWAGAGPDAPGYAGATDAIVEELTTADAVLERLGGPERRLFLAGDGTRWLGLAATKRIDGETSELAGILVRGDAAGRGVGTALVREAVGRSRDDGAVRMIVSTEVDNDRAIAFYRSRGFVVTGERVEAAGEQEVPVVMLERRI